MKTDEAIKTKARYKMNYSKPFGAVQMMPNGRSVSKQSARAEKAKRTHDLLRIISSMKKP